LKIQKLNSKRVKTSNGDAAAASPVTPRLLREVTQKLVQAFRPKKIILFGSYAYGKPFLEEVLEKGQILYGSET
jgi:hypothetical protein